MGKLQAKQAAIARQVLNITDEEVLDQIMAVLSYQDRSWWDELPGKVRQDIKESLAQADAGVTVSHSEAMKRIQEWRKR